MKVLLCSFHLNGQMNHTRVSFTDVKVRTPLYGIIPAKVRVNDKVALHSKRSKKKYFSTLHFKCTECRRQLAGLRKLTTRETTNANLLLLEKNEDIFPYLMFLLAPNTGKLKKET